MKKHAIGMALCAATFFAFGGTAALAESASAEGVVQKPAKTAKKRAGKKNAHAHTCKCGKAEKECTCEHKKHEDHGDEHRDHAHEKAEDKK